jgi:ketosteroid isomerase-like protein
MKKIVVLLLMFHAANVFAQHEQQEINTQVWEPFIQSFNTYDTNGFMAVHSKDVVRSPRDSKNIWNWEEYFKRHEQSDLREKSSSAKRVLELRFTERIASKDQAIEVGVYKTTIIKSDGISKSFFGRFHVVLRKEEGVWKILVDTDSSEKNSINEKDFLAAYAWR